MVNGSHTIPRTIFAITAVKIDLFTFLFDILFVNGTQMFRPGG